jgi:hypothetical protein
MKKQFENWLAMFNSVLTVLKKNQTVWQSSTVFTETVSQFETQKAAIDTVRKKSAAKSNGVTSLKDQTNKRLVKQIYPVITALMAYFTKQKDTVMLHKVKITKSELSKMRDNAFILFAKEIQELAHANQRSLTDYHITPIQIDELDQLITDFEAVSSSPRISIGEGKVARLELSEMFKTTNNLLSEEIDMMMEPYEKTDYEFYKEYMNARKVVQYGVRHEKEEITNPVPAA